MQNGYIESFNSKFRDECLNEQWFQDLQQARSAIKVWRQDYNEVRPHNSCERVPPAKLEHLRPPPRSTYLATPGFLFMNGTAKGGGSAWRDPAAVAYWARDVPRDRENVVYCVYGHEVGRATALRLRAQGNQARCRARRHRCLAGRRAAGRFEGGCVVKVAGDDDESICSLCCGLVSFEQRHG